MRPIAAIAVLALFAACSQRSDDTTDSAAAPSEVSVEPTALDAMPEQFQGSWDFAVEDCSNLASEQRLTIEPNKVDFYESSADITAIERSGPTTLNVNHAFTGEGEQWEETLGYALSEDGQRLTVTADDGSLSTRMRCPTA